MKLQFKVSAASILCVNQANDTIIVQSRDNFIRIFDFEGQQLDEIPCESLHFCKFVVDNDLLIFCNPYKPGIVIYDTKLKSVTNIISFVENLGACTALSSNCPSEDIWIGYEDGSCVLTSLKDGSTKISKHKHSEPVMGIDSSPDRCVSCGADDKLIFHHNSNTAVEFTQLDNPGASCVKICGSKVLVCGWNAKLHLYDNEKLISTKMEHRKQCRSADYHVLSLKGMDTSIVAVGSEDMLISVWKVL